MSEVKTVQEDVVPESDQATPAAVTVEQQV